MKSQVNSAVVNPRLRSPSLPVCAYSGWTSLLVLPCGVSILVRVVDWRKVFVKPEL
jgi:hypothetical protein